MNNAIIQAGILVKNLPSYELRKYTVVRLDNGESWYYGTYDDYSRAEEVAKELGNGYVIERWEECQEKKQ